MEQTATLYSRSPGYATANLGEELAVLDLDGGAYLGFNATASAVWRFLEAPQSLQSLCSHLMDTFAVDEKHCRVAVSALIGKLCDAGLVRKSNDPV